MEQRHLDIRVIVSGGGTGGHIFPAISIADAIRERQPNAQILFVGAKGKMEMDKVPAAGYEIVGLPVAGFQRRLTWRNVTFVFKLLASLIQARGIVKKFKPDVVVGVGGYASGPVLNMAIRLGIPTLIQEQNSYPGVTNRLLAKKVNTICVAYEGMEKYFPVSKIVLTGNPVRKNLLSRVPRREAADFFGLDADKPTVLVVGGSLGAKSVNQGVLAGIDMFVANNIQVIWQTGKYYFGEMEQAVALPHQRLVKVFDFIARMDFAYALADVVVSRAGASSISEIALLGKPSILVPSPNVSEDHQTKNAMAMVAKGAAVMVKDNETYKIAEQALLLLNDSARLAEVGQRVISLARPMASQDIVNEVFKLEKPLI